MVGRMNDIPLPFFRGCDSDCSRRLDAIAAVLSCFLVLCMTSRAGRASYRPPCHALRLILQSGHHAFSLQCFVYFPDFARWVNDDFPLQPFVWKALRRLTAPVGNPICRVDNEMRAGGFEPRTSSPVFFFVVELSPPWSLSKSGTLS